MAKWVTFNWDIVNGVRNLTIHPNKEEATKYFKVLCKSSFEMYRNTKIELPMTYGYYHRKVCGMSKRKFENEFGPIEEER